MDQLIEEVAAVSGPLKKYRVTRGGVETVMKLSDADAARLGVDVDDIVGGVSTIHPVQPVEGDEADDGPADEGSAAPGDADGDQSAQQVQSAADDGGDGQAPSQTPAPAKKAAARKTAAKRVPAAQNKAREGAQDKAADGGDA